MPTPLEIITGRLLQAKLPALTMPTPPTSASPSARSGSRQGGNQSQTPPQNPPVQQIPDLFGRPQQDPMQQDPDAPAPYLPAGGGAPAPPPGNTPQGLNPQAQQQAQFIQSALMNPQGFLPNVAGSFGVPYGGMQHPLQYGGSNNSQLSTTLQALLGMLQPALAQNPAISSLFQPQNMQVQSFQSPTGPPNEPQWGAVPMQNMIGPALQALLQLLSGGNPAGP